MLIEGQRDANLPILRTGPVGIVTGTGRTVQGPTGSVLRLQVDSFDHGSHTGALLVIKGANSQGFGQPFTHVTLTDTTLRASSIAGSIRSSTP